MCTYNCKFTFQRCFYGQSQSTLRAHGSNHSVLTPFMVTVAYVLASCQVVMLVITTNAKPLNTPVNQAVTQSALIQKYLQYRDD